MPKTYHDQDADLTLIQKKKVAIIGYGSQGHAHALNLKDSGVDVRIGLPATSKSIAKAQKVGLEVLSVADAAKWGDVIMILAPDTSQAAIYENEIKQHLTKGKLLMFAHGFNIRYDAIKPPADIDVSMVAPRRPAIACARSSPKVAAPPVCSPSTRTPAVTLTPYPSNAKGIGCTRAGVIETTFTEETETDLFGEQAVLCGGVAR